MIINLSAWYNYFEEKKLLLKFKNEVSSKHIFILEEVMICANDHGWLSEEKKKEGRQTHRQTQTL
jgi:hypothetical protein